MPKNILAPVASSNAQPISAPRGKTVVPCSTSAFFFITQGESLLMGKTNTGLSAPGGKLEPGETPLQAALRETRQEIGNWLKFELASQHVLAICTPVGQGEPIERAEAGKKVELKLYFFGICTGGEPKQVSDEMKAPTFVPFADVRKLARGGHTRWSRKAPMRPSLLWVWNQFQLPTSRWDANVVPNSLQRVSPNMRALAIRLRSMNIDERAIEARTGQFLPSADLVA